MRQIYENSSFGSRHTYLGLNGYFILEKAFEDFGWLNKFLSSRVTLVYRGEIQGSSRNIKKDMEGRTE